VEEEARGDLHHSGTMASNIRKHDERNNGGQRPKRQQIRHQEKGEQGERGFKNLKGLVGNEPTTWDTQSGKKKRERTISKRRGVKY